MFTLWPGPGLYNVVIDTSFLGYVQSESIAFDAQLQSILSLKGSERLKSIFDIVCSIDKREVMLTERTPPFPYLIKGDGLLDTFKGVGTNNAEVFKCFIWASVATIFYQKACADTFGRKSMIQNLSKCMRATFLARRESIANVKLPFVMQPGCFYEVLKMTLEIAHYNVRTKPPATCSKETCRGLLRQLGFVLTLCERMENAPRSWSRWISSVSKWVYNEFTWLLGVYMSDYNQHPLFPSEAQETCEHTAYMLRGAQMCLKACGSKGKPFIQSVEDKLRAGYAYESSTTPFVLPQPRNIGHFCDGHVAFYVTAKIEAVTPETFPW